MVPVEAPNRRSNDRLRFSPAYTRVVVIPSTPVEGSAARGVIEIDGVELGPEFEFEGGSAVQSERAQELRRLSQRWRLS